MSSQLQIFLNSGHCLFVDIDDEKAANDLAARMRQAGRDGTLEEFEVTDIDGVPHAFVGRQIFQVPVIDGYGT